ncbi:hypothetical protein E4T56_gene13587, partial [Termitomyces sp. T112]
GDWGAIPRPTLGVVPAKAGTHTPQQTLFAQAGNERLRHTYTRAWGSRMTSGTMKPLEAAWSTPNFPPPIANTSTV